MTESTNNLPWFDMQRFLRSLRWMLHPITVFVTMQLVWLAITLIWVIWFVGVGKDVAEMTRRFGGEWVDDEALIAILVVGCVLLGVILVGIIALFVFWLRQSSLVRRQRSFLSSVTHELKSPLASLQLTFETLTSREIDDDLRRKLFSMALTDIDRLRRTVDQILIAGRLDRGIAIYRDHHQRIRIRDAIDTAISGLTHLDPHLKDRLVIRCPEDLATETSKEALQLVLANLIENAVKYSPRGTPITVSASREQERILLTVEDQGIGLDRKEKRRIFKMFHRAGEVQRKAIPGSGLGLFIVRSALHILGGRVWAESEGKGRGSTFHVTLPAK